MRLNALYILSQISLHTLTACRAKIRPPTSSTYYPQKDISRVGWIVNNRSSKLRKKLTEADLETGLANTFCGQ